MISARSTRFKYIDRDKDNIVVLIPGWATDYRIFDSLDLDFNYLVPIDFSPFDLEEKLLDTLRRDNIKKVSLFGFSLGGFVAQEFALRHPSLIDELILVGIRKRYNPEGLSQIEDNLKKNKRAYLYKFYSECFTDKERMRTFRKNLLKSYIEEFDLDYLINTLGYFRNARIKPESLKDIEKIKIMHGGSDKIAPIEEALEIKDKLPHAEFISIKDAGHIPFYG